MPNRLCLLVLLTAATVGADTLLLKDGTLATITIADTGEGWILVKHGAGFVKIDKQQVERFTAVDTAITPRHNAKGSPLPVGKAIERIIAGYAAEHAALTGGGTILFVKTPLAGSGKNGKTGADFSNKMVRFLGKHGHVRNLTKEGAFLYLSGAAVCSDDSRYCALSAEISVRSAIRKTDVSSFVQLDTAGNFVPTKKGTTLKALERETTVRFVVIDHQKRTVVFDERVKDIDKGLQELAPAGANDSQNRAGKNSILIIETKLEKLLEKQFK